MVVENIKVMKAALQEAGLSPFLMAQPCGYHATEAGLYGYVGLQDFPYGKIQLTVQLMSDEVIIW